MHCGGLRPHLDEGELLLAGGLVGRDHLRQLQLLAVLTLGTARSTSVTGTLLKGMFVIFGASWDLLHQASGFF